MLVLQLGFNEPSSSEVSNFSPKLLAQKQDLPPSPPADRHYEIISYKVPSSSPACKDFKRAWQWCFCAAPPSIHPQQVLWLQVLCMGKHHGRGFELPNAFHPGSSSCILSLSYNFRSFVTFVRM